MRRRTVLLLTALLAVSAVGLSAQKGKKPAPPPPPTWTLTLPDQFSAEMGSGLGPTFYTDGAGAYVNGVGGLVVTTKVVLESTIGTYTQFDAVVPQTSGRRLGVQGLSYAGPLYNYPEVDRCVVPMWIDESTLGPTPVSPYQGCLTDFLGGPGNGHFHPPAPYDRFTLRVQLRGIDITALGDQITPVDGFVDTWFGDYYGPAGVCQAQLWSNVNGAFLSSADHYTVQRTGPSSWRVFVRRQNHGLNESIAVITGTGKRTKCSLQLGYTEKTGPIEFWFDIGY
jgi:hypothetical protein